jgi:uridine phosphorylase
MRQYHIQVDDGEVGRYVLLPGDPGRSEKIASLFENPQLVATNREFVTYTGTLAGVKVSVCSTGIGSPSSAIAMEELGRVGADTFIRVGTCGGLQKKLHFGDLVVISGAVRDEGTSPKYLPLEFPAIADLDVINAFRLGLTERQFPHAVGVTVSTDAFYAESETADVPMAAWLGQRAKAWRDGGALCAEMECSTLFVIAALRGWRAGGLMVVVDEVGGGMPDKDIVPLDRLLDGTKAGLERLIDWDRRA